MGIGTTPLNSAGKLSARAQGALEVYRVVGFSSLDSDGNPRVIPATAAKSATLTSIHRPAGVTARAYADLDPCEFYAQPGMRVLVMAGAAINADRDLMVTTGGKVIEATTTAGQYTQLVGHSVDGALADGDLLTIVWFPVLIGTGVAASSDLEVPGNLLVDGRADVVGDITAAGGFRQLIGPWVQTNVGASQAAVGLALGASGAPEVSFRTIRAGSITGITASLSVAAAGSTAHVIVNVNGTPVAVDLTLAAGTHAGLYNGATFAKDLIPLAAGDKIEVTITTDGSWTDTGGDLSVFVEIEE